MMRHRLAVVLLWSGFALLGGLFSTYGYLPTWRLWHLPAAWPPFMDARVLTAGAAVYRQGGDPMVSNPTDSAQRPVNYPRLWHGLYALGLNERHALPLALVFIGLFLAALTLFVWRVGPTPAWPLLATCFSPAILLGIERGNTDLVIFAAVAGAALAARRHCWLALGFILLAFALKLYPLAAIAVLLGCERKTALRAFGAAAALGVLYLLFIADDLALISAGTPRDSWISYGRNVIVTKLAATSAIGGQWASLGSLATVVALVAWAGAGWWQEPRARAFPVADGLRLDGFRAGAACYLGTFLAGYSFDYRLMFLLLTVPQLSGWRSSPDARLRAPAWVATAALVASTWTLWLELMLEPSPAGSWCSFLGGELAAWVLFGALLVLFVRSLPAWLQRTKMLRSSSPLVDAPAARGRSGA